MREFGTLYSPGHSPRHGGHFAASVKILQLLLHVIASQPPEASSARWRPWCLQTLFVTTILDRSVQRDRLKLGYVMLWPSTQQLPVRVAQLDLEPS
jgi:hypothetical protein